MTDPADKASDNNVPGNLASRKVALKCAKRKYECDECEYSSNDKKILRRHVIRKHTGDLPYKCEYSNCNYGDWCPAGLREHMKVHANEKEYECNLCDYRCNLKTGLYKHKRDKHELSDEALQAKSQKYRCSQCGYTTGTPSKLAVHQATHLNPDKKPFRCEQCSYTACRKIEINRHMISKHGLGEKKPRPVLTCEKCDFTAVAKTTIDKHVAKCKGAHPYTCTKCDYKTAVLKNLYSHAETHVNSV